MREFFLPYIRKDREGEGESSVPVIDKRDCTMFSNDKKEIGNMLFESLLLYNLNNKYFYDRRHNINISKQLSCLCTV